MTDDQQARRSAAWMTFFYVIAILSWMPIVFLFLLDETHIGLFVFFVTIGAGSFLAGSVNLLNWRDMLILMFEDETPNLGPPRRESRTTPFNAAHNPDRIRLEVIGNETGNDNVIYLGKYGLTRGEWRKLISTLRDQKIKWKWSRRLLQSTEIFPGLTVGNRYNDITKNFEDAQAVKAHRDGAGKIIRAHVTNSGIEALHKAAGMGVVTS